MHNLVLLPLCVLGITLLVLWRRAHGPLVFMSVCFGYVLVTFAAPDVAAFLTGFMGVHEATANQWVKIGLLLVPVVLTLLFTGHAVARGRLLFNLVPALAGSMLLALLLVPLLPAGVQHSVAVGSVWNTLQNLQTDVLLAGGAFSLLYLFVSGRAKSDDDKKKKHD